MIGAFKGDHGGYTTSNVLAILRTRTSATRTGRASRSACDGGRRRAARAPDRVRGDPQGHARLDPLGVRRPSPASRRTSAASRSRSRSSRRSGTIGIVTSFLDERARRRTSTSTASRICSTTRRRDRLPLLPDPADDPRDLAGDRRAARPEWREAASNLGATRFQYWRYIGMPVLMPSHPRRDRSCSSGTRSPPTRPRTPHERDRSTLVPILIGNDYSGNVLDNPHLAQALAFGMFVVLAAMMLLLHPAAAARVAVGEVKRAAASRPRRSCGSCSARRYFLIPLVATLLFSLKEPNTGKCCTPRRLRLVLHDAQFWATIKVSFRARARDDRDQPRCSSCRRSTGCT